MLTDTTSRRVLIGVTLVLAINSQLNTRHLKWVGRVPNAVVKTLTNPPASMMRSAVVGVKGEDRRQVHFDADAGLTEQLAEANAIASAQALEIDRLNRQLDAYRAAASARGSDSIRWLPAQVVDQNLSRSNPSLELDRGSRAGVEAGDPVTVAANLMGFIQDDVGALRSSVQLVTLPGAQYLVQLIVPGAVVAPEDKPVYVYADDGGVYFYVDLADGGHDVRVGDLASMADDLYPQADGYILGEVTEVRDDHPDKPLELDRIIIRPAIELGRQRNVMIQVKE